MDRKDFFTSSVRATLGCCALSVLDSTRAAGQTAPDSQVDREKEFLKNWLTDLFDTMDAELDEKTKVKLMAGCGAGCFRRHQFKRDIAEAGKSNLENLLQAYKKNFQVWREGDKVHVRYGEVSKQCYCPAARYHPAKPNDMHCECTRATHQTIFETALDRKVEVTVVETLRRGGKTCHFVANVA